MKVLNNRMVSELQVQTLSSYKQNEMLLDFFCDNDINPEPFHKLDRFVEALSGSHQSHLAALLTGNLVHARLSQEYVNRS